MSNHKPSFSIIVPTMNSEEFIVETINSVIRQTFTDWELIISDDGSTDKTLSYLNDISNSKIRIVRGPQKGSVSNFNYLISLARGKYIKPLGHDDYLFPSCLEDHYKIWTDYPSLSLITSFERSFGGKEVYRGANYFKKCGLVDSENVKKNFIEIGNWIGGPQAVSFKNNGEKFDENFKCSFDLDLWMRLSKKNNIFIIKKVLYGSRIHKSQLSNKCIGGGFQRENALAYEKNYNISTNKINLYWIYLNKFFHIFFFKTKVKDYLSTANKVKRIFSCIFSNLLPDILKNKKLKLRYININDTQKKVCCYRGRVSIDELLVNIRSNDGNQLVNVRETPHYQWAKSMLVDNDSPYGEGIYNSYIVNNFPIVDFNEYKYHKFKVMKKLSEKSIKDIFVVVDVNKVNNSHFVVFDGAHRLAMLAAKQVEEVEIWSVINVFDKD